ncbi:MAG: hypothetical protein R2788_26010 [Saprospiraceae bacterium]
MIPILNALLSCSEHNSDESIGFILNKKLDMRVDELIADFPEFNAGLFWWLVKPKYITQFHNVGDLLESSRLISSVWWGGNFDKLKFLITNELIKPQNIRFLLVIPVGQGRSTG